jgi:Sigma-70 region 2
LAAEHERRLLQQACGLSHELSAAEDLVAETLVEAWRSISRYNGTCRRPSVQSRHVQPIVGALMACVPLIFRYYSCFSIRRNRLRWRRVPARCVRSDGPKTSSSPAGSMVWCSTDK